MIPVILAQVEATAESAVETMPDSSAVVQSLSDLQKQAEAATAATAGAGVLAGGLVILWIALAVVGLFFFIWWIILLVDLLNRDFPQRQTYLILMILSFFISGLMPIMDLVYYFGIVKKNVGTKKGQKPTSTPPATQ